MKQMTTDLYAFSEGDLFLKHFLPGDSDSVRNLRGTIYSLNIAHKNKRMVPSILLQGERGVGKGYVANLIAAHLWWLRKSEGRDLEPAKTSIYQMATQAGLRIQTMTALPDTLAEAILFGAKKGAYTGSERELIGIFDSQTPAHGRSDFPDPSDVFLDEIGDTPKVVQAKLLEVLETGSFRPLGSSFTESPRRTDARIIAATNRNMEAIVNAGEFRADLYDRLSWVQLFLPPLREQLDQLSILVVSVNESLCVKYTLGDRMPAEDELAWARGYSWPGNLRELAQVLWEWHLFDGKRRLEQIVSRRIAIRNQGNSDLEGTVTEKLFGIFDDVLAERRPGFNTYGGLGEEMRRIAYSAIYRYHRERKLKEEELKRLFGEQDAINVRKQISENRPRRDEK